ncbi:hypothetical protein [Lamprobacter sp.]|uniref:hypothetical protein n=1 Tax=Lamprobacter sp. TaxID=3100796 RepID=UPI002B2635AE|nr:hypothetical protein [Lamprobacter sp.]
MAKRGLRSEDFAPTNSGFRVAPYRSELARVKQMLIERGVTFPAAAEVRMAEGEDET